MERLLLHVCCAPDATVALERLQDRYDATAFFYNPNIEPIEEYKLRESEAKSLAEYIKVEYYEGEPQREIWGRLASPYHSEPERGERCRVCIAHRLDVTARRAMELGFEAFSTTLTTSPHKDVDFIHETGRRLGERYGVKYVPETFRAKDGFRRSIELSREYGLYRQDYCGCHWSYDAAHPKEVTPTDEEVA